VKKNHSIALLLIGGIAIGSLFAGPGFVRRDEPHPSIPQTFSGEGEVMGVAACMGAIEKAMNLPAADSATWTAAMGTTDTLKQIAFIEELPRYKSTLSAFAPSELSAFASNDWQELNGLLTKAGYDIRLSQFPPSSIGAVAIVKLEFQWLVTGATKAKDGAKLEINGHTAFRFVANEQSQVFFANAPNGGTDPVIGINIPTQYDDNILIYPHEKSIGGVDLYTLAGQLQELDYKREFQHDGQLVTGVDIPKVDYNHQTNISWLLNMQYGGSTVAQAIQQVVFQMNEQGGKAGSGTAMEMAKGLPPTEYFYAVDKPFVFVYARNNVPIFACHVTEGFFKDPGTLQFKK
jgi:hypothetical protein